MNKELSAYLDLTRVLGTLIVFFGQVELNWVPGGGRFFEPVGNESLAVMFVVSGFVIGFVSDRREKTLKSFLIHRCARAYSLLIPCVIVGFFLDSFGKHFMAAYYLHGSWPPLSSDVRELAKALFSFTFLGEAWGGDFFPGSMAPYWTFPYEWTYYLLFAALWYLRGWQRLLTLLVISAIAGPQVLMMFPLWLLGTIAYWVVSKRQLSMTAGRWIFFSGVIIALTGEATVLIFNLKFGFGVQESPELWPFYLSAILYAFTTVGFRFSGLSIARYTGWAQWAAGGAGSLYLLHFPLSRFINGLIPFAWPPAARWLLLVIPVIAISLLFAEFTEKRREAWRRKIEAGVDFIQVSLRNRKVPLTSQDL